MIVLRHDSARAVLYPERGGLLAELQLEDDRGRAVPLLWLPETFDPKGSGWPGGGMPFLFPFAGRVFHEGQPLHYRLGDSILPMPKHGFAYSFPWEVTASDQRSLELTFSANASTIEFFPYDFKVKARYMLSASALDLTIVVEHADRPPRTPPMPLAMGLHPYFRVPFRDGVRGSASGVENLDLENFATEAIAVTPAGAAGSASEWSQERIAIEAAGMDNLILGNHRRPQAAIVDRESGLALAMQWEGPIHYLVLWCRRNEGFYCVEPWMGLPDAVTNQAGLEWLAPGSEMSLGFRWTLEPQRNRAF